MKIILLWNFVIIPGAINRVIKTMCVWCEMFAHIEWSCVHVFMNVGEMYHKMWISIDMQLLGVVDSIFVWGNEGIKNCVIFLGLTRDVMFQCELSTAFVFFRLFNFIKILKISKLDFWRCKIEFSKWFKIPQKNC